MAKSTRYSKYLEILDYELQQKKDGADTADAEKFRILPHAEAPRIINEVLKALVQDKPEAYSKEVIFYFFDSTVAYYPLKDGEYYYIDINECVEGNIFKIPNTIKEIQMFVYPGTSEDTTQRDGIWTPAYDSSFSINDIYAPSKDELYNVDGWNDGDELRAKVVFYPDDLKASITPVAITTATEEANAGTFSDKVYVFTLGTVIDVVRGDIIFVTSAVPDDWDGTYQVAYIDEDDYYCFPVSAVPDGAFTSGTMGFDADDLVIGIDDGFIRLLTLEIKKVAYSRKGKAMSQEEYYELTRERRPKWVAEKGRINSTISLPMGGARFGESR